MKLIHRLTHLAALVLGLSAGSSYGTYFSYSYAFGDGQIVSGSLDGTQNGNFVENISNVSVLFNGVAMLGNVFAARYDGADYVNGPVVSFDAMQNNFVFANADLARADFAYDSLFYMLNASVFEDTALGYSGSGFAAQDWPTVKESWSLSVPESGSTFFSLGLGMLSLAWIRRKAKSIGRATFSGSISRACAR